MIFSLNRPLKGASEKSLAVFRFRGVPCGTPFNLMEIGG
ncbi:hypothetical protein MSL71_16690 [Desulfoluna butyratoxydans]|uniref:Uncharacterized protein n=1 Tax=Desulfoluna butyratoxydans TaxID=231438 RepID=A0A4U8YJR7_9BACT|nr:hypothetical protein MSL71_16690 [Desulfoluna butyratoxydans]